MRPQPPVRTLARLRLAVLLLVLSATAAVTLFAPAAGGFSAWEFRPPASFPAGPTSLHDFRRWPGRFEAYVGDAFPGRSALIQARNTLLWRLGLLRSPRVIEGPEGWLFLSDSWHETLRKSRGLYPFDQDQAARWTERYESLREVVAGWGGEVRLVIIPDKQTVYPHYLPEWARPGDPPLPTMTDQILAELSRRRVAGVLDLRSVLRTAAVQRPVFWKTDSHWNGHGARVAMEHLLPWLTSSQESAARAVLGRCQLSASTEPFRGDLANILGVAGLPAEFDGKLRLDPPAMTHAIPWQGMGGGQLRTPFRTAVPGGSPGKLLVLGDSFLDTSWFVLAELKAETAFFPHHDLRISRTLLEQERPNTVLLIIVERLIPAAGPKLLP